jgi:hypothetical protein
MVVGGLLSAVAIGAAYSLKKVEDIETVKRAILYSCIGSFVIGALVCPFEKDPAEKSRRRR